MYFNDYPLEDIVKSLPLEKLEDKGDHYICCCPYHSDSHPSYSIQKEGEFRGLTRCWSCNTAKSIFTLYKDLTNNSMYKDFNLYHNKLNYEFKKEVKDSVKIPKEQQGISFIGELVEPYANVELIEYLNSRGIGKEFIDTFQIKYARKICVNDKSVYTDRFVIPCFNEHGELVSFEARAYKKNYSGKKTLYPTGSTVDLLFNFDNIDITKPVVICEGILGLSSVYQHVTTNVVSTFGKLITKHQRDLINKCPHAILIADNDDKIVNGELVVKDNLDSVMEVFDDFYEYEYKVAEILELNSDPNDLSIDKLKEIVDNAKYSTDYLLDKYEIFSKKKLEW